MTSIFLLSVHFFLTPVSQVVWRILYPCCLLPTNTGCSHTPWDLPYCLTSPVIPVELILLRWAQAVLVPVKKVMRSAWRTWSGVAAGTEDLGTVKLLAFCYSGSYSIISANELHAEFLRPSRSRSGVSFCVYKGCRLWHLQPRTVCRGSAMTSFDFVFCSVYWEVFWELLRAGQICRMFLSCHKLFSACYTSTVMKVWESPTHLNPSNIMFHDR